MVSRLTILIIMVLAPLALAPAAFALNADELEAKVLETWQRQKSVTADLRVEAEMMGVSVTGTGKLAVLNEGESGKYTQRFVLELPPPLSVQATMDVLYDGHSVFLVREILGEKEAFKLNPGLAESAPPPGGKLLFDLVKAAYTLDAGEDTAVEKRPAYVLRCTPKDAAAADPMTIAFDKETGLAVKVEISPKDAEKPVVVWYTNVAVNTELDPASFVFTLADGTQLQDKTQSAAAKPAKPEQPAPPSPPITEAAPVEPQPAAEAPPAPADAPSEVAPAQQ